MKSLFLFTEKEREETTRSIKNIVSIEDIYKVEFDCYIKLLINVMITEEWKSLN